MATNITITEQAAAAMGRGAGEARVGGIPGISSVATGTASHAAASGAAANVPPAPTSPRRLPGWLWFVALWCGGVGAAMGLGFAFKVLMNLTLFAVK